MVDAVFIAPPLWVSVDLAICYNGSRTTVDAPEWFVYADNRGTERERATMNQALKQLFEISV